MDKKELEKIQMKVVSKIQDSAHELEEFIEILEETGDKKEHIEELNEYLNKLYDIFGMIDIMEF